RSSAPDIFQCRYRVMTSKNGADFVHFVMPAQAPASQNGQSRDKKAVENAEPAGTSAHLSNFPACNLHHFPTC
ncbi:MAG TPA: hypothetical protein VE715_12925, partial [Blastocatellia bacterium]|nr:hypothetical protein [Blastocatellia bacterium]